MQAKVPVGASRGNVGLTTMASLEKGPTPDHQTDFEEIQSPGAFHESAQNHPEDLGPPELERASRRLSFPPSYVVVGIYRLINDKSLLKAAWDKCRHGTQRGLAVGFVWVCPLESCFLEGCLLCLLFRHV